MNRQYDSVGKLISVNKSLIFILLLFFLAPVIGAQESAGEGEIALINDTHEVLSNQIQQFADQIDGFFGNERVLEEANRTQLLLGIGGQTDAKGRLSKKPRASLRLHLPRTSHRWRLLIESSRESGEASLADDALPNTEGSAQDALNPTFFSTAFQYVIKSTNDWHADAKVGVAYRGYVDPFVRARVRRLFPLWVFNVRVAQTVNYFVVDKLGETSSLDIDRKFMGDYFFRASSVAEWRQKINYFELSQTFSVQHALSKDVAVSHLIGVFAITEPNVHVDRYLAQVRMRWRIYKRWTFFEIRPELTFPAAQRYAMEPTLTAAIEIVFGQ